MVEFNPGDRVEYRNGPCSMHHGKKGSVSHVTRGGWVVVDFDCGDEQIQCAETSLAELAPDHKALLHWVISNLLNESQLSVVPPGYNQALRHILKMD